MSEYNDPVIQLYRRGMGLPSNPDAVSRAIAAGYGGPKRAYAEPTHQWPNYDGTDDFGHKGSTVLHLTSYVDTAEARVAVDYPTYGDVVQERHDSLIGGDDVELELLEDTATVESFLKAAAEEIAELEHLYEESRLTKADFDPNLVKVVAAIETVESSLFGNLADEHPKWTNAIEDWVAADERFHEIAASEANPRVKQATDRSESAEEVESADKAEAKASDEAAELLSLYEDLAADLANERRTFEDELVALVAADKDHERQAELAEGLEYYDGLAKVCEHSRLFALARVDLAAIQRLYGLAA